MLNKEGDSEMGWVEKHGFHDSIEAQVGVPGDLRMYDASDFALVQGQFYTDGIKKGEGCLQVVARPDLGSLKFSLQPGFAMVRGYHYCLYEDAFMEGPERTFTLRAATQQRIDRIVLRLNTKMELDGRFLLPYVLEGQEALNPVPTPLTRDRHIWELALAEIHVYPDGSTLLSDTRYDPALCGLSWYNQDIGYQEMWDKLADNLGQVAELSNTFTAIRDVTLPQENWAALYGDFEGQFGQEITDERAHPSTRAMLYVDEAGREAGLEDALAGGDTFDGYIRFRASRVPEGDVHGELVMTRVLF